MTDGDGDFLAPLPLPSLRSALWLNYTPEMGGFMSFASTYSSPCEGVYGGEGGGVWSGKGDERYL